MMNDKNKATLKKRLGVFLAVLVCMGIAAWQIRHALDEHAAVVAQTYEADSAAPVAPPQNAGMEGAGSVPVPQLPDGFAVDVSLALTLGREGWDFKYLAGQGAGSQRTDLQARWQSRLGAPADHLLLLPVGQRVLLTARSVGVAGEYEVPALGLTLVPATGQASLASIQIERAGTYDVQCRGDCPLGERAALQIQAVAPETFAQLMAP
ncbi:MAG: hypothetical protein Q4G71_02510 [Pseudomonadota bacterium]|nr:hypothetical protein [Pseudomonadota bacterium]